MTASHNMGSPASDLVFLLSVDVSVTDPCLPPGSAERVGRLLPPSLPLSARLLCQCRWNILREPGPQKPHRRHLRPGSWPEGLKKGPSYTKCLGSLFTWREEEEQLSASKRDCPNKQTNKQCLIQHKWRQHTPRKTGSENSRMLLCGAFPSGVRESWWVGGVVFRFLWSEHTPSSAPGWAWKKAVPV